MSGQGQPPRGCTLRDVGSGARGRCTLGAFRVRAPRWWPRGARGSGPLHAAQAPHTSGGLEVSLHRSGAVGAREDVKVSNDPLGLYCLAESAYSFLLILQRGLTPGPAGASPQEEHCRSPTAAVFSRCRDGGSIGAPRLPATGAHEVLTPTSGHLATAAAPAMVTWVDPPSSLVGWSEERQEERDLSATCLPDIPPL